jgi:cell division protein FtsW (lipid II flippase)
VNDLQKRFRNRTRKPQRRVELGLLLLDVLIILGAYLLAQLGHFHALPPNVTSFLAFLFLLVGIAHIALRRFAPYASPILLPAAALLNGIGYVYIARLDSKLASAQAMWSLVGIAAFVGVMILLPRIRDLERYRYTTLLVGLMLLVLPAFPIVGRQINGARIWIHFGPFSFQPGEMAKIALAIFFASYLIEKRELLARPTRRVGGLLIPDLRFFGPVLVAWGFSLLVLMRENDLGSSLLFFALFVVLLWIATGRSFYLILGGFLFTSGALLAYFQFNHVRTRIAIWRHPFLAAGNSQLAESIFAIGSGGLFGSGIALGSPDRIPFVKTDFIFSAIGEEWGFLGVIALLSCYLLIVGVGMRVAIRAQHPFEKLLTAGLTSIVAIQVFIIVGGVTRLIPLTGITLPFVSYGGSSLVANYILLALLLRASNDIAPEVRV